MARKRDYVPTGRDVVRTVMVDGADYDAQQGRVYEELGGGGRRIQRPVAARQLQQAPNPAAPTAAQLAFDAKLTTFDASGLPQEDQDYVAAAAAVVTGGALLRTGDRVRLQALAAQVQS